MAQKIPKKAEEEKIEKPAKGGKASEPKKEEPPLNPKSIQAIIAAAKSKREEDNSLSKPLLSKASTNISGQKKMNYMMFKKAEVKDSSEEELSEEEEQSIKKKKKSPFDIDSDDHGKKNKKAKQQKMDVDSDREPPKGKKKKTIFDDDSEEEVSKVKAPKGSGRFNKEGYLYKKKRRAVLTQWEKRYFVLENSKLLVYTASDKKTLKKTLDFSSGEVTQVCFHYDKDAPVQSKRIDVKDKDDSRFDIYVKTPIVRAIMLRTEEMNQFQAEDWVETLQGALNYYSPPFDPEINKGKNVNLKGKK